MNSTTRTENRNDLKATRHSGSNAIKDSFQNTWKIIAETEYLSWNDHWLQAEELYKSSVVSAENTVYYY